MLADRPLDPRLAPTRELPLVVHSAARWNPTWHRPHQLLRALAEAAPVLVVEEPVVLDDVRRERLDISEVAPGVWRALPRLPAYLRDQDRAAATVRALLLAQFQRDAALRGRFRSAAHWFSHAGPARELAGTLGEVAIVCDCLAPGAAAPMAAAEGATSRERFLLAHADLVLASGVDAADALAARHPLVSRVDDGVDASRFALARDPGTAIPNDLAALPRPILGYAGPVDDRLDPALLAALVARVPQGSVVLVGPPGDGAPLAPMPRGVRWLGARDGDALPGVLKGFDVAVFPLRVGHAAAAADAGLLLESLVAGLPVVASAAGGAVTRHADVVHVAHGVAEFAAAAEAAVAASDEVRGRGVAHAERLAWPRVATRVRGVLFEAIAARSSAFVPAGLANFADVSRRELGGGI